MNRRERIKKIEDAMLRIAKIKAESIQDKRCKRGGLTRVGVEAFKARDKFLDGCGVCIKKLACVTRQCIVNIKSPDGAKDQNMHNALRKHGWLSCGRLESIQAGTRPSASLHEKYLRNQFKNEDKRSSMTFDDWSFLRTVASEPQERGRRKKYMDYLVLRILQLGEDMDLFFEWIVSQSNDLALRDGYMFLDMTLWSMRMAWKILKRDEADECSITGKP